MAEGKEIKFKFIVDEQSAQRVNRVLDEMIKRAQDLAKTLQGVGGAGGGGIMGGGSVGGAAPSPQTAMTRAAGGSTQKVSFASALTQNVDALKKLASEGGGAMKLMGDAVQRGITQQQREIFKLQQALDALVRTYDKVGGAASGALGEKIQDKAITVQSRISAHQKELAKLESMRPPSPELMPEVPWPGQEKPGMMGRFKNWATSPGSWGANRALYSAAGGGGLIQGFAPQGIGGWLRVGGMALAGADAAFSEARSGTRAYNEAEANRGRLMNRRIRALKGGDVSDIMALQMMGGMDKEDLAKQVGGTGAQAEATISGIKKMFSRAAGSITGGVLGEKGGNILGGMTDAEQEQMKAENLFKQVDNFKDTTQYLRRQMAMEHFEGTLESRVGAGKLMGLGFRRKKLPGGGEGPMEDAYSEREASLREKGFSVAQEEAAFSQVMGVAGRAAGHRRKYEAMSAAAGGYAGYGELLGISERMGMGNVLAQASVGGGVEKTAGIQLGQALLGTGFDVQGMTSRAGVMAAMQAGMGFRNNAQDFPLVQQGLAGLQMGSAISTGQTSPYQRGANLLAAINSGAGNTYLQDYLGNQMSFEKMLDVASGADSDKTLEALGGDREMVKKTLSGKMTASLSTLYDKGLEGTEAGDAIKRFRESGLGLDEYLQKARKGEIGKAGDIETLGIAAAQAQGQGQEAGIGMAKVLSGMGSDLKLGQVGAGKLDDMTASRLKKDADRIREAGRELAGNFEKITEAFKASGGLEKAFESFGQNLSASAEVLHKSFVDLADAAGKAAMKLNPAGQYGGQKPATGKAGTR